MRFNEAGKIRKLQQQMQKAVEASLIDMMVIAQNHFTENFRKQGFDDRQVENELTALNYLYLCLLI